MRSIACLPRIMLSASWADCRITFSAAAAVKFNRATLAYQDELGFLQENIEVNYQYDRF